MLKVGDQVKATREAIEDSTACGENSESVLFAIQFGGKVVSVDNNPNAVLQ